LEKKLLSVFLHLCDLDVGCRRDPRLKQMSTKGSSG